jgi:hypothetical protein
MNLCIIFSAGNPPIPDYQDEVLFLHFKSHLFEMIDNTEIIYFGHAPDNTADGDDDLLTEGTFFRIISAAEVLNLNLESSSDEVLASFKNLIEIQSVNWGTVIVEKGFITTEITIEFIF